ncbi:hypothetical protein PIB30_089947 [Stylosanthes scabra]|uniref:Uncharacterized protein n=1 Tax=Stylosanthes scabra TaxID=79078 RepID=A0ABU6QUB4_9FABA|nr:hypothetical protein [Stylosanthes scabra]
MCSEHGQRYGNDAGEGYWNGSGSEHVVENRDNEEETQGDSVGKGGMSFQVMNPLLLFFFPRTFLASILIVSSHFALWKWFPLAATPTSTMICGTPMQGASDHCGGGGQQRRQPSPRVFAVFHGGNAVISMSDSISLS